MLAPMPADGPIQERNYLFRQIHAAAVGEGEDTQFHYTLPGIGKVSIIEYV